MADRHLASPQTPDTSAAAASAGPAPHPADAKRRPPGSRLLRVVIWGLVAMMLLAAGLVFLAGRTVTLQWAAQQAVKLADGKLQIDGISGSVLSEIAAESVRWEEDGVAVAVTAPRFTYHPLALLDGKVRVERISAANVEIDLPPPAQDTRPREPVRLPGQLAAMLPVAIERIDIGRVIVRRGGSELAKLHNLEVVLRHEGDRFNASLLNLDVIAGGNRIGMRGEASVLARAPYATDGRVAIQVPLKPQALRVDVRINGPLEELSVRAGTAVAGAPLEARTVVHTFDARPLRQVRLDLKDFDLSRYDPSLPATRLTGSYDAEVMPAWASERKPLLIGPLILANSLPGSLDRNRIPIADAKAVVGYVEGRVEVQGLQASGPLGDLAGDGWAGADSFRIALTSDKLQLRGIDSTLAPRTLTAKLAIEPIKAATPQAGGNSPAGRSAGGLSLDLRAVDATLAAEMKAVFANSRLQISRAQVLLKPGAQGGGSGRASFSGSVGVASPWPVDLSGDFRAFDPAQLVAMPPGLLNGQWRVAGRIAGGSGGELKTELSLADSRLRGLPLAGRLAATLSLRNNRPQRLAALDGSLKWGASSIQASGALGEAADTLRLAADLPRVAEVQDGLAGAVRIQGTLRGPLLAPAVEASIDGRRLVALNGRLRASVAGASVQVKSAQVQSGVLNLLARLDDVDLVRLPADKRDGAAASLLNLDRITALVDGSLATHSAELNATGRNQRLSASAKGGMVDGGRWHGVVEELSASHPLLRLPAPAGSVAGGGGAGAKPAAADAGEPDFQSLQAFAVVGGAGLASARNGRFDVQGARLNLRQLDWEDSVLTLNADATGIAARWLGRFINLDALYAAPAGAGPAVTGTAVAGSASATPVPATPTPAASQDLPLELAPGLPQGLPRDLLLAAAIDFTGDLSDSSAAGWRGTVQFRREAGDVALAGRNGSDPVRAGLEVLEASATVAARDLRLVVNVDGTTIGRISAEARTTLQSTGGPAWAEANLARSPLAGRVELAMSSFRWVSPLMGDSWSVDGALSARLQLAGTLTRPRAEGVVTGNNLSAEEQALGMRLSNGVLAAELAGDRIDVKVLRFESGEGSVAVSGLLQAPGDGRSEARIVIDRLPIPLGAGQRIVLSGSTTATLEDRALNVSGRLVADEGVIELQGGDAPSVSGDVVFVDAHGSEFPVKDGLPPPVVDFPATPPARKPAAAPNGASADGASADGASPAGTAGKGTARPGAFGINTDIEVDLGRNFRVFGSGLEAYLRGAIRVRGKFPEAPRATGTVEIVDGSYQIYGRQLKIKRGRVIFNGPLDNPALDIVAIREHLRIEPGVEIGGTAASPVVRLISDPEVPDAEKLSWLVLGTGLDGAQGAGQLLALQAAATSLFGDENARYAPGLTERLGIDVLSVREQANGGSTTAGGTSDNAQGAVVTVGKRLSSRLFVTYEQSLRGVWNILKLQYEITDRLSLSVQAGSDSAIDILWFFPFD